MRFTQEVSTGINVIRGYAKGELRVNDNVYRGALILSATTLIDLPNVQNLEELLQADVAKILALEPVQPTVNDKQILEAFPISITA